MTKVKNGNVALAKYMKLLFIGLIALGVIALAMVIYSSYSKDFVGKVGNEKVSVPLYKFWLEQEKSNMLSIAGNPDPNVFWETKLDGESAIDIAKRKALENTREWAIQLIKAKEAGTVLTDEDNAYIDQQMEQTITNYGGDKAAADEGMKNELGIGIDDYKDILGQWVLIQKFLNSEFYSGEISDDEVRQFYDNRKDDFDKVSVRHILIQTKDKETGQPMTDIQKEQALIKANEILDKVNAGEDMEQLAKMFSEDPGAASNGGLYEFNNFDSFISEFKTWAFEAKVGDTGVVESDYGYHVMKLLDRKDVSFEEVDKENIKKLIRDENYSKVKEEWKKDPKYEIKLKQSVYDSIK